jgi:hypothetical protein
MTASNALAPRFGPGSKPTWSEMELDFLKQFYASIPAKKIAFHLKRTPRSITCMAFRLGLKKSHERLREMGAENVDRRWGG